MPMLDGADRAALQMAADRLACGHLLAFPTETVYGLGARADDDAAVAAIFIAKGRPSGHPLIVHVAEVGTVAQFAAQPGEAARRLMAHFWPGPLTLVLPRLPGRAVAAAGGHDSIALRLPSHPLARALLRACADLGVPGVAAPSANRFGRISPTSAQHVRSDFGGDLWVLDGGACDVGIESAIIDCTGVSPALLRPGALDRRSLERVLGRSLAVSDADSPPAPGTLNAHYAPVAPVQLLSADALRERLGSRPPPGAAVYSWVVPPASAGVVHRPMPVGAAAVAHELFAVLRQFDALGAGLIWVEQPPAGPEWDGVRDRLQRAAATAAAT